MPKRPIHDAFDLLGRRWAMRLVWELRRDALSFTDLRARCKVSPSVLTTRLTELRDAGVVICDPGGRYLLSPSGRELARLLYDINRWAEASAPARLSSEG
jgi:DNA-binding HxlR family transcriptional regulator